MKISAIRANGLDLPPSGFRQATDELSKTPNPVDAVNLSTEAVEASQHHIAYSLSIKTQKIEDEIAHIAVNFYA